MSRRPIVEGTALANLSEKKQKAMAVLQSLASGDSTALQNYVAETYIQHNLDFPTGRQTIIDALPMLVEQGAKVAIRRVIEDGDRVAVHSEYDFFGPKIGFDVFRFEGGLIVEHWDNLQATVTETASGRSMIDGPTEITDLDRTAANKALVRGLIQDVLMGASPDRITDYISSETYSQHNPTIEDGLAGIGKALETMAQQGIMMRYDTLHQVIGEGNFVLTLAEGEFAGAHTAFYDLFRIENGKIVEHWDVLQTIPPRDQWKSENGKF
jgi:predicted SnoaL-like aldol condensation-catalyzing enzyme